MKENKKNIKSKAGLTEAEKMEIVEHLTQNHDKCYGRLTGDINLAKQKKFWDQLATSYSACNINSAYQLKEIVRNWTKRANEKFEKTSGKTGASGDDHLTDFQIACRELQRQIKGDEYMIGISSIQSSGTNQITTSTPKFASTKTNQSTALHTPKTSSKTSTITSASTSITFSTPSTSKSLDSDVHSKNDSASDFSNLKLPKPSKRKSDPTYSASGDETSTNLSKNQLMQAFCDNKAKDSGLKYQQLELEKNRLEFEREKWELEKKLIEKSIEEKRYKGMFYYLKCRELCRSPQISLQEIPMNVEFRDVEVQQTEEEKSFAESVSSTGDDMMKDSDYDPSKDT